jgi:hypothetical protein
VLLDWLRSVRLKKALFLVRPNLFAVAFAGQ